MNSVTTRNPAGDRVLSYVLLAVLASHALCFLVYCYVTDFTYMLDDAYINYEYAQNFAAGHGLVFNEGERIWGYTSPLQTVLLALFAWAGFDPPAAGTYLSIVWIALTSYTTFRLVRSALPGLWSFLVALYFLTYGHALDTLGLESALLVLLQVSFLWSFCRGHFVGSAFLAGFSCLARPDSFLLVAPVLLTSKESRRPRNLALFILPGALWLIFALGYYGDVVPRPLYAKTNAEPHAAAFVLGFLRATTLAAPPDVLVKTWGEALREGWNPVESLTFIGLSLLSLANVQVRRSPALAYSLIVYPWLLIVAYSIIGSGHYWEIFSAYFFFKLSSLVGLFTGVDLAMRGPIAKERRRAWIVTGSVVTISLSIVAVNWARCFDRLEGNRTSIWGGSRHRTYQTISQWINENVVDGASVQAMEIGVIGYMTDVRVIDTVGLVTEGVTIRRQQLDMRAVARQFRPDYLLTEGRRSNLVLDRFLRYRTVKMFSQSAVRGFFAYASRGRRCEMTRLSGRRRSAGRTFGYAVVRPSLQT